MTSLPIERSFADLSNEEISDIEKASNLARLGWASGFGWNELLRSRRILLIAEAGTGKTYECRTQQAKLWNAGEAAFFLELATLAGGSVREMLSNEEEDRLDQWLRSQSDVATFFLDSVDELKLTLGKFDQALKRLNKALAGQLARTRIVITTRPVPVDRELIVRHLPIAESHEAAPTAEAFADMVMDRQKSQRRDEAAPKLWRNVSLMPLSVEQMREFAALQGVADPDVLVDDICQRDAEEFAQRPQDLVELCSDWREHHRIRSHKEQVASNIATKLKPNTERKERAELSQEAAIEGAGRVALAAILTRKLTLRHDAASDTVHASEAALDVSKVLQNWTAETRITLLERPLFGFASYGRVRFHHRSILEFLAAERLRLQLANGVSIKSIKRLLFAETAQGAQTVRPSMRPVAAWLALSHETIFDEVIRRDPAVVLDYGDPQSLRPSQRIKALEAYVDRYGFGGSRGLSTPRIQVHRLASTDLSETITKLWNEGIENPEVRHLLLQIIGAGKLTGCAGIAYDVAIDGCRRPRERNLAIETLVLLADSRLEAISASLTSDPALWPDAIARHTIVNLFPTHLPIAQLGSVLQRVKEQPGSVGDLTYQLPRLIRTIDLLPEYLDQLRAVLTSIVSNGIVWDDNKIPHVRTKRPDLIEALLAACARQAAEGTRTPGWVSSTLLALHISKEDYAKKDYQAELKQALADLSSEDREYAFWQDHAFLNELHQSRDSWHRVFEITHYGGIRLDDDKDAAWVRKRLSDSGESLEHREMMLWAEMLSLRHEGVEPRMLLESLKQFITDAPNLLEIVDRRLTPQESSEELRRLLEKSDEHRRRSEERAAADHVSWVGFWLEVARDPNTAFAGERAKNTAWNLWQAVERSGRESRASGWNRRFIEGQFGRAVADKLRETMMSAWRSDKPSLRSERCAKQKNTFLIRWQFGLAGIAAEAEDASWASKLSEEEAELACRYVPVELNGFPSWFESLAVQHPAVVDRVLGTELSLSLEEAMKDDLSSTLLANVSYASEIVVALFAPRVRAWISTVTQANADSTVPHARSNVLKAIEILIKSGSDSDRQFVEVTAKHQLANRTDQFAEIWLPVLLNLNPAAGVDALEAELNGAVVEKAGAGVRLFASLFDREDDRGLGIALRAPGFTGALLLRVLRLIYQHVRLEDDALHEGTYSPDMRDHAQRGRNEVLSALFAMTGHEGWLAKLELAADPAFANFKDRAIALAEERAAEEADSVALTESEFAILDKVGETPPMTREAMFALIRDRLDDIDDLLLQDISPRELWANIKDEHIMRRELSRVLRDAARQAYTVDQEAVTADEKETDIRLRSSGSTQQGTIELKLGDDRTGTDLFNTIRDQLLTKYMAAEDCRAGCLLVTIAIDRGWNHPKTGERIKFEELIAVLNKEAGRLSRELGGTAKLMARGLDLRPRLKKERER